MYSKDYFIRYGDLDFNGEVKISAILDILQDVSICHSDEMGYTRERLASMSVAWLLSGWKIKILSTLNGKNVITAKTAITTTNKFQATRKYELLQNGECKIIASAEWFMVDTSKMSLTKIPEEISSYYNKIAEEPNKLEITRLRPSKDLKEVEKIKISNRDTDTNKHLNNVKSAEILFDYIPENAKINEIQLTYKKQLHKGDVAKICISSTTDSFVAELKNQNDESCVLLNMK